jgi:ribonuclease HIII
LKREEKLPSENFEQFIALVQSKLNTLVPSPIAVKKINYGEQLILKNDKEKVTLSIYNGKKGRKLVWGGQEGPLQKAALAIVELLISQEEPTVHNAPRELSLLTSCPGFDNLWAGSDESGKGDFFGPLVVGAVLINKDIAKKLYNFGVRDSKELTDKRILELANKIEALAPLHVALALKPEAYNLRYEQMKAQGYNLNDLLAAGHVAALTKVLQADKQCHFALVDRFSQQNNIAANLQKAFPGITVVQQPKAEEDMAVAAASILARAKFVNIMAELSELAGRELPKGGGENATAAAKEILASLGRETLDKLVKKHFNNYKQI